MTLTLVSTAFAEGDMIPQKYARTGENLFPPLRWQGAPRDVQSFALIVEDPDAPSGTFRHCGIFDIPADWCDLPHGMEGRGGTLHFSENDFDYARYDGPEPPRGHGLHHYHFKLAALDVPTLPVTTAAGVEAMWREARRHIISQASLTGTFEMH